MDLNGIDLVTAKRRERVFAYLQAEDKARCLVSGLLLRKVCGVVDDNQLVFGKNGKPYLKDGGIYFNISHSGDYVALATSEHEVGVDIEKVNVYSDAVAIRCFSRAELEWMQKEGCNEAFYFLWTAKESVMKACGLGLSLPPETFSVLPNASSPLWIAGRSWFLNWISYDGHVICRAATGKPQEHELLAVSASGLLER
jgi:4'-phosphopantetheinyl transferase